MLQLKTVRPLAMDRYSHNQLNSRWFSIAITKNGANDKQQTISTKTHMETRALNLQDSWYS